MRVFDFGPAVGRHIERYGSDFTQSRLARSAGVHVSCMHLAPGGRVGFHPAATPQLFAVVAGNGWARGEAPERVRIAAGRAVLWDTGERHEAGTENGMIAIVVEGDVLAGDPDGIGPLPPLATRRTGHRPIEGDVIPRGVVRGD